MLSITSIAFLIQAASIGGVDSAVAWGMKAGSFPGAVVVVGTSERMLMAKGYGYFTWSEKSSTPSWDSTLYDLASLTKVVATAPSIMRLVELGRLDLDASVQSYLPEFTGSRKDVVTIRHLLQHRSGLRAFLPLHEKASTAEEARHLVAVEPLRWKPGSRYEYSDLNAMLLGWIVEKVTGVSLDRFVADEVFLPLNMMQTMFSPPPAFTGRTAPVGLWRGHVIAGELHDQNAVRLGGVSGHAGLYATGSDLARYAQMLLGGGRDGLGKVVLRRETVALFTARGEDGRALGWEMRDTTSEANSGSLLSSHAFGHGGFTGTSIWIDPVRDLFVIVLTNRVFAPRTSRSITILKQTRGLIADAAVELKTEICGRKCD